MPTRLTVRVGTFAGVPVRLHLLLPAVVLFAVLTTPGYTDGQVLLSFLVFFGVMGFSILFHEVGHAVASRRHGLAVHGILIWPLGGLTYHDPAHRPRTQLAVASAGVIVNLLLAVLAGSVMVVRDGRVPGLPDLYISTDVLRTTWNLNLALAVLNLLPGLPFDGGTVAEALLWPRIGRPRARLAVIGTGAVIGLGLILGGFAQSETLLVVLGGWGLFEVGRAWQELREGGLEEEGLLFGSHDLSGGLPGGDGAAVRREREEAKAAEKARRLEAARAEADRRAREEAEGRLDALLERIAAEGIGSLSPDERAFLNEESRRLRALQKLRN